MKTIYWRVSINNPINNETIGEEVFENINDIADKYKFLSLQKWRNICLGRSRIYNTFLNVEKQIKT
jgi:hypothetical protein